jgi:TonB family protein
MKQASVLLAAAVFIITSGSAISGAQGSPRRIGAVGNGGDSIIVSAAGFALVSTLVVSGRMGAVSVATTADARTWVRRADSIAHVAMASPGRTSRVEPIEMAVARGGLSYSRILGVSDVATHEILSPDFATHQPIRISLSGAQLELLVQYVARAADVSDSLTLVARQTVGSLRKANPPPGNAVYFEFQVERRARPDPQNAPPAYPAMLRAEQLEGTVLAQFIVDTTGLVEPSTFKVLKTPHILFSNAVKIALPNMRFAPAEVGGVKVRQLVQMPFPFTLP